MFVEITTANYIEDYKILVTFNNGESKIVDFKNSLRGKIFEPLLAIEAFKHFKLNLNTIEWENGADFAPEYIYEIGVK